MTEKVECAGCGCSKWACDAIRTSGKVCCPDCGHGKRVLECDQCGAKPSEWGPEWAGWSAEHGEGSHCPMDHVQGCDGTMRPVRSAVDIAEQVRAAAKVYAYRAALCEKLHGNAELNRRERAELAGEARAYGWVANELSAILSKLELPIASDAVDPHVSK